MAEVAVTAALTRGPLARRFYAYTRERFPVAPYALATGLFFFSGYLLARSGAPQAGEARAISGLITVFLFFFVLRVMDEHKDARDDSRLHPDRPVPRGLVRLTELRALATSALAIQVALNVALGGLALAAYLAVLAFVWLMYREFFVAERLRAHPIAYGLSHMLSLPLLAAYAWAVADGRAGPTLLLFAALSYGIGALLELARKVSAPEDERPEVFTYSSRFGPRGVSWVAIGLIVATALAAAALGGAAAFGPTYELAVVALAIAAAVACARFAAAPSPTAARRLGTLLAPIYMAGIYGLVIAHAAARSVAG